MAPSALPVSTSRGVFEEAPPLTLPDPGSQLTARPPWGAHARQCPSAQAEQDRGFSVRRRLAWQSLRGLPRTPRTQLREMRRCQAVGWLSKWGSEKRAGTSGCSRRPRIMFRLAAPKGLWLHRTRGPTQMLRVWKGRSWSSRVPSSGEAMNLSPHMQKERGRSCCGNAGWRGDIPSLCKVSQVDSMWEYLASCTRTLPPTMPQSDPFLMYIVALSIVSLNQAVTSVLSRGVSWKRPSARFKPRRCPWYQNVEAWSFPSCT